MDSFGIGVALKAAQRIYFVSARRTGRTMGLVASLKTGDRVCFTRPEEAERVQRMCEERGVTIETIVVDPKCPARLYEHGTAKERFVFDHSWVEQYYTHAQERAESDLAFFTERLTGFGEAHLETRRQAAELKRWQP